MDDYLKDDYSEIKIKHLCCTCLSRDRKLFQLCRLKDGVNNLYLLLSFDSDAYREGFYKETTDLYVCWECKAIMDRISSFRAQVCKAQKLLTCIQNGHSTVKNESENFSHLSFCHLTVYKNIIYTQPNVDNFIDCGSPKQIKLECDLDDIPLSELNDNQISDNETPLKNTILASKKVKLKTKHKPPKCNRSKKYFDITQMSEIEMVASRQRRKSESAFVNAAYKCVSCLEVFKTEIQLERHNLSLHVERGKHVQCNICKVFLKETSLSDHINGHYQIHNCQCCGYICYELTEIQRHLKTVHALKNIIGHAKRKKDQRILRTQRAGKMAKKKSSLTNKRTPFVFLCKECNKYFDNKNQRWKHVQQCHREGHKCATCGKRFAFKNNLLRHEQLHQGPLPREKCPICEKMIRIDRIKVHEKIHSDRQKYSCVECEKSFISRQSYEHHLKYTQAHSNVDILKYKCEFCEKGYRSRGELRDHVNYQHMGRTQHKCPVCGKGLATKRCITRHIRRAHEGVKENARDKICQQCGKAFRDKKGLREHESIHSGERPLACELCGLTFRHSSSLYTHKKRVHNTHAPRIHVRVVDS